MGAAAIEVTSKGTIDGIGQVENKDIQTLTRIINFLKKKHTLQMLL